MIEKSELKEIEKTEEVDSDIKEGRIEAEQEECKINKGESMENEIKEFDETMDSCKISGAEGEDHRKERDSELQDVGVAGGGKVARNYKRKTKDDRNVSFSEQVEVSGTSMSIESCAQLDDTLPIDDEPLEIADKMNITVPAIIIAPQDVDEDEDPADKIRG